MTVIRVHLPGTSEAADGRSAPTRIADRSYDIVCGRGILDSVGPTLRTAGARRAVLICDGSVAATHGTGVYRSLADAGIATIRLEVTPGEASKSVAGAGRLWEAFARETVDRETHIVAVGGGVTGDLAGFVAATFARGLPLWHVPTTLVAQVDSAIGGKTGINLEAGKNLAGAFWQPRGVFVDGDTLSTLPTREFVSGLAEVVKYGMIFDADFFAWLEDHAARLLARDQAAVALAVEKSAAFKAAVVERDEREITGLRAALNYGHTFAHALETATGYGRLLHGEAVAIGMDCAARLAALMGRIAQDVVVRQSNLLRSLDLPTSLSAAGNPPPLDLLAIMARDKKAVGGRLRFVLPKRLGEVETVADITPEMVLPVIGG